MSVNKKVTKCINCRLSPETPNLRYCEDCFKKVTGNDILHISTAFAFLHKGFFIKQFITYFFDSYVTTPYELEGNMYFFCGYIVDFDIKTGDWLISIDSKKVIRRTHNFEQAKEYCYKNKNLKNHSGHLFFDKHPMPF